MAQTAIFEAMLQRGQDSALLRHGLGSAYLKEGKLQEAIDHFAEAVRQDLEYSAAWKLYGKALAENGEHERAIYILNLGLEVAKRKGDRQAAKEMETFRRRSEKALTA